MNLNNFLALLIDHCSSAQYLFPHLIMNIVLADTTTHSEVKASWVFCLDIALVLLVITELWFPFSTM